jgi:hypothetical protein
VIDVTSAQGDLSLQPEAICFETPDAEVTRALQSLLEEGDG